MERLEQLQDKIENAYLDAFLVTDVTNIFYLTGFKLIQGDGLLLVYHSTGYLITDDRYEEALTEFDRPHLVGRITRQYFHELAACCSQLKIGVLGFETQLSYREYELLDELMTADIVPMTNFVETCRMIKDSRELNALTAAAQLHDAAFEYLKDYMQVGMSEIQVANQLDWWMKRHGASGASFETIVASGANAAKPHALATTKLIENGDIVILDYGYFVDDYTADVTRTVGFGTAAQSPWAAIYATLVEAKQHTIAAIAPKVTGHALDSTARAPIAAAGYGQYFNHGIGHGIGLAVHELPASYGADQSVMHAQQVVTVEPGIYLPNQGGVRVEDDVLVTTTGHQQLTTAPNQLPIL